MALNLKEAASLDIIGKAISMFGKQQAATFTGGKDSLVLLHLIKRACGGQIPFPVLNIDTTVKFAEVLAFRDMIAAMWKLDLIVLKNAEAAGRIKIAEDKKECCRLLKINVLNSAVTDYGLRSIFTGIRWDEQRERAGEEYFSVRDKPHHTRVNPILHFTEDDVWAYIRKYRLLYCKLYDEGYRSLGCEPCTAKGPVSGRERDCRSQDKEEKMKDLRMLGYF